MDGKISLSGQQWSSAVEEGYLPRSLEEIVRQKIAAWMKRAAGFWIRLGVRRQVSLSMLTGSSDKSEAKILEFVDKAVSQGSSVRTSNSTMKQFSS